MKIFKEITRVVFLYIQKIILLKNEIDFLQPLTQTRISLMSVRIICIDMILLVCYILLIFVFSEKDDE